MGLTLTGFQDLIATDLKVTVDTEISKAELNRAVQRAVDDLSRYFPLEEVYEETLDFTVTDEAFTTPAAADPDFIVDATGIASKAAGDIATLTNRVMDVPRQVTILVVEPVSTTITSFTLIVKGTDENGKYIEESFHFSGGLSQTGKKYFKTVVEVEFEEITGNATGDTLDVGTGNAHDAYIFLANKPIKPQSETVTCSAGTVTLVRDTDYRMDYANGRIKFISKDSGLDTAVSLNNSETDITCDATVATILPVGTKIRIESEVMLVTAVSTTTVTVTRGYAGTTAATHSSDSDIYIGGMAAGISYLIDYTKSRLGFSISSLLPIVTRIQRVQYPVDLVPQQFVSFNIIGDFMYIASKMVGQSQEELTDGKHVAIYYERKQMPPSDYSSGSYPDVLDEVIAIGAAGYALLTEAQEYEQAAAVSLTAIGTALGNAGAKAALAGTALGKVATYLEINVPGIEDGTANAKGILTAITTDALKLRTRIDVSLGKADTYLSNVETPPSAHDYLIDGDDKIDYQNIGARVAENYADYARASMELYQGLVAEASVRVANIRTYIEEAGGWNRIADTFIAEASQRANEAGVYIAEAGLRAETANGNLVLADRFRAEGLARLSEFHAILRNKAEYRRRTSTTPVKQPA